MLPSVGPPRGPLPYPLAEPTSLTAPANLLAFRATPDGLLCPGRDACPRPGRGCAATLAREAVSPQGYAGPRKQGSRPGRQDFACRPRIVVSGPYGGGARGLLAPRARPGTRGGAVATTA